MQINLKKSAMEERERELATETVAAGQPAANAQLDPEKLEVAAGTARQNVEGWVPEPRQRKRAAFSAEQAFEYRDDVTE